MTKITSILIMLFLASCSSNYDKREVTKYLTELKELNQILITQKEQLDWENDPETISSKFPQTQELIEFLRVKLNLTKIDFHDKIDGKANHLGLAYRFGNPKTEQSYSFLIFTQNQSDLELFKQYEQFIDCGKSEIIEGHWAFSRVIADCNN